MGKLLRNSQKKKKCKKKLQQKKRRLQEKHIETDIKVQPQPNITTILKLIFFFLLLFSGKSNAEAQRENESGIMEGICLNATLTPVNKLPNITYEVFLENGQPIGMVPLKGQKINRSIGTVQGRYWKPSQEMQQQRAQLAGDIKAAYKNATVVADEKTGLFVKTHLSEFREKTNYDSFEALYNQLNILRLIYLKHQYTEQYQLGNCGEINSHTAKRLFEHIQNNEIPMTVSSVIVIDHNKKDHEFNMLSTGEKHPPSTIIENNQEQTSRILDSLKSTENTICDTWNNVFQKFSTNGNNFYNSLGRWLSITIQPIGLDSDLLNRLPKTLKEFICTEYVKIPGIVKGGCAGFFKPHSGQPTTTTNNEAQNANPNKLEL